MITKEKTTNDLAGEIKSSDSSKEYLAQNSDYLLRQDVSELLNSVLCKANLSVAQVIKRSGLTRSHVYHIFNGKRLPSRDKLIAIAFGLGLNDAETDLLLKKCRFPQLYARDARDAVIMFSLSHGKDIFETNLDLENQGFEPLK